METNYNIKNLVIITLLLFIVLCFYFMLKFEIPSNLIDFDPRETQDEKCEKLGGIYITGLFSASCAFPPQLNNL